MIAHPSETRETYVFYISLFCILASASFYLKKVSQTPSSSPQDSTSTEKTSVAFKTFQRNYLAVYLIMMGADWLQGPYVYALYESYGYSISEIGRLFIMGFASSMVFGPLVGSAADKLRTLCILFGLVYALACVFKHIPSFPFLVAGRILSGIATAILFSSFESWMVKQHQIQQFPDEWIKSTFALSTSLNGFVAVSEFTPSHPKIGAGILASFLAENFGPTAPFKVSAVLLLSGSLIISRTWSENYGDKSSDMKQSVVLAFKELSLDRSLTLLGVIQSCFEGGMYIFVFMWTPALESVSASAVLLGWVFACYMICITIGCSLFEILLANGYDIHNIAISAFTLGAFALFVPVVSDSLVHRLIAFFMFEVSCGVYFPSIGTLRSK